MKKIKIITILLIGLMITGCSKAKPVEEEKAQEYSQATSSSVEESTFYGDDDAFYEPIEGRSSDSVDVNRTATEETKEKSDSKVEVIKTNNGNFKIEMPTGWESAETKELSDNADISLKNTEKEAYYMVLSEAKKDFDSFSAFKSSVDLSDLGEKSNETKKSISYNGLKGERRTFVAKKDDIEVYYIYDLMEGKEHYLQCISWTLNSSKEANEKELIKLMDSLAEM